VYAPADPFVSSNARKCGAGAAGSEFGSASDPASESKSGHQDARALGSPVREMGSVHPRAGK